MKSWCWYTRKRYFSHVQSSLWLEMREISMEVVGISCGTECSCDTCKTRRGLSKEYLRSSMSKQIREF